MRQHAVFCDLLLIFLAFVLESQRSPGNPAHFMSPSRGDLLHEVGYVLEVNKELLKLLYASGDL